MSDITVAKLQRLYPRFCGSISLKDTDITRASRRSEVWVMKLVEDAYDEAMRDCCKSNIANRLNRKAGLDLGSMDSFPSVVKRLLQQKFSVLEVMQKMTVEFLLMLHQFMNEEKQVLHSHIPKTSLLWINAKRSTLFCKFLSEEFDLTYLALFLHCREATQMHFGIKFANLVQQKIWYESTITHPKIADNDLKMGSSARNSSRKPESKERTVGGKGELVKGVPIKLPQNLSFMQDTAVPEVSLICFELSALPFIFSSLFPGMSLESQSFLADRVIETAVKLTFRSDHQLNEHPVPIFFDSKRSSSGQVDKLPSSTAEGDPMATQLRDEEEEEEEAALPTVEWISVYTFMFAVLEEWRKVPLDTKDNIAGRDETTEHLRVLNVIYDKDSLMLKEIAESIKQAKIELSFCESKALKLEKSVKRLERKWQDGQTTDEELDTLAALRVEATEARVERAGHDEKVKNLTKQESSLMEKVHSHWNSLTVTTQTSKKGIDAGKKVSRKGVTASGAPIEPWCGWRVEIATQFGAALQHNEEDIRIRAGLNRKSPKKKKKIFKSQSMSAIELELIGTKATMTRSVKVSLPPPPPPPPPPPSEPEPEPEPVAVIASAAPLLPIESIGGVSTAATIASAEPPSQLKRLAATLAYSSVEDIIKCSIDEIATALLVKQLSQEILPVVANNVDESEGDDTSEGGLSLNGGDDLDEFAQIFEEAKRLQRLHGINSDERQDLTLETNVDADFVPVHKQTREDDEWVASQHLVQISAKEKEKLILAQQEQEREREARMLAIQMEERLKAAQQEQEARMLAIQMEERLKAAEQEQEQERMKEEDFCMKLYVAQESQITIVVTELIEAELMNNIQLLVEAVLYVEKQKRDAEVEEEMKMIVQRNVAVEEKRQQILDQENRIKLVNDVTDVSILFAISATVEECMTVAIEEYMKQDTWYWLDPVLWDAASLDSSDFKMAKHLQQRRIHCRAKLFMKILRADIVGKRLSKDLNSRRLRFLWDSWIKTAQLQRVRFVSALKIQGLLRRFKERRDNYIIRNSQLKAKDFNAFVLKQRAQKMLKFWRYVSKSSKKGRDVILCIDDRRFIKSFYIWLLTFKTHRINRIAEENRRDKASVAIQTRVRVYLALKFVACLRSQLFIVRSFKSILAKRKFRLRVLTARKLVEAEIRLVQQTANKKCRIIWRQWAKRFNIGRGCRIAQSTLDNAEIRYRLKIWKMDTVRKTLQRSVAATKIQALVRLRIVRRIVFDYYKWRRGLVKVQSLVRRKRLMRTFAVTLYIFRAAQKIQKTFRGGVTRAKMTESRIVAMHYAAAHNNYERLLYFVNKYPEIISELDYAGNTALHNAAANASRRTLKLLLRCNLDPNAMSVSGYSPLHLVIMSSAVSRDDCCLYMLDHGFDEDQTTKEGRSCLMIACEYGRNVIAKQLLSLGLNPNTPDNNGYTCLQLACANGHLAIVKELVDHDAYVNSPGYCGTVPLHDCIAAGDVEFPKFLLKHGAYLNVTEPYYLQTPLMWACAAGSEDTVRLYLLQGADSHVVDVQGRSAAHHATISNNSALFFALREAEVDFDQPDHEGNTPLHIATEYGSVEFVECLLHGLVYPSPQNKYGDQPSHIAARLNNVPILSLLSKYDEHIGRINLSHQTPLGVAKMFRSKDAQQFLESHFTKLEVGNRNAGDGHIWWDKGMDDLYGDWVMEVSDLGIRTFTNKFTGESTHRPPPTTLAAVTQANLSNEISLRKNVEIVRDGAYVLTKHDYLLEHAKEKQEFHEYLNQIRCAVIINRYVRRKLAYLHVRKLRKWKNQTRLLARFVRNNLPRFKAKMFDKKMDAIIRPQAVIRGFILRRKFYRAGGLQEQLQLRRFTLHFKRRLWKCWKNFKFEKLSKIAMILKNMPQTVSEWQLIVWRAKHPTRVVGMFEEFLFPGSTSIHFYRHRVKLTCSFQKPAGLFQLDEQRRRDLEQIRLFGFTPGQARLAEKLQALWRGYRIRSYFVFIEKAMRIYLNAEESYMMDPTDEVNLYNYALYCHSVEHDYPHARELYNKAIQRMEQRGPDISFILYAYAIFSFVTHDQDFADIAILLDRARAAELHQADVEKSKLQEVDPNKPGKTKKVVRSTFEYGKVFKLASVGFFRHSAIEQKNAISWHNYAACSFLVYNDFEDSFDAFLNAFRYDPTNRLQRENFDVMMAHFHGNDKDYLVEIVKLRMQKLAARDSEADNAKRKKIEDEIKNGAAVQIQRIIRGFVARARVQNMLVRSLYNRKQSVVSFS